MKTSIFNSVGEFFALDIGSSAIRVVQLKGSGTNFTLLRYGAVAVDVKTSLSDSAIDQKKISETIATLVEQAGITTKSVAVGLPSNKTFTTIVDLPKMTPQELHSTIKYQAEQYIPMSVAEAKVDAIILGDSPVETDKMEVLIASVTKKYSEQRMEMLESIGLDVVALEPDAIALARALGSGGDSNSAEMIIDMGEYACDVVITINGIPRLTRSIPTGGQSIVKSAIQNLNIDENQAKQFVYKFGLDESKLEGQIKRAIESTVEVVSSEVQKSLKFFATRYKGVSVSQIKTAGAAALVPGFHQYLSAVTGNIPVQAGNCWQKVSYSDKVHEQLMTVNPQFAVAVGLAQRRE